MNRPKRGDGIITVNRPTESYDQGQLSHGKRFDYGQSFHEEWREGGVVTIWAVDPRRRYDYYQSSYTGVIIAVNSLMGAK